MAKGFNLTAELNLRGPANIKPVIANLRRQLSNINVDVGVKVSQKSLRDIASMQQSLAALNSTLSKTQSLASSTASSLNSLGRSASTLGANFSGVPKSLNSISKASSAVISANQKIAKTALDAGDGFAAFGKQSALAIRRFAAFATVTGVIFKFTNALSSATSEFIEFNRQLVRVSQVTGSTLSQLSPLVKTISALSTQFGVASKDLIQVSSTLSQAGLSARDTERALKALALSALAPSFDNLNDTVEGSIALMRQFGLGAKDLESALGSVNAVAAAFAVEAGDLITAIQRTGGVFAAASKGVSEGTDALNEFLAIFTSIRQTTRESAETIATGLRTIFTRIQRSETIEALKEFGVVLTDLEGKFVGPFEAVRRLSEGLSRLDPRDLRFSEIVEELGGFRQIGKVIPLIQQFAVAQQALKVAQRGQSSLAQDAAVAQLSLANRITKVREEFNALVRSLGESSTFQTFVKLSLDLASALIKLADSAKTVLPALTAIAAFRGAAAITKFGSGFAKGFTTKNAGGYIKGFASGGYVPGVGNSDTVPAMLTPGEFVIRKKAVEKIGVGNLQNMNGYNSGGFIQKFAQRGRASFRSGTVKPLTPEQQEKLQSLEALEKEGIIYSGQLRELNTLRKKKLKSSEASNKEKASPLSPNPITFGLAALFGDRYESKPIKAPQSKQKVVLKSGTLPPQESLQYQDIIIENFKQGILKVGSKLSQSVGASIDTDENRLDGIIRNTGLGNIVGSVLEGSLGVAGAPFLEKTRENQSIDFPLGLGPISTKFGLSGSIPTDATRTSGSKGKTLNDFLSQVDRFLVKSPELVQKLAVGGFAKAPLVDDIRNASGTISPRPSSAIAALIRSGGGAIDIDRTIKRTIGDKAYGTAKTSGQQSAVLDKYFRDPKTRLRDVQSAPLTSFGKELQKAIQSRQINPNKLSIISKSIRTPGVAEYLSELFGIPLGNMIFTQGGSKQPAVDAMRTKGPRVMRKFATGGSSGQDTVPALLTPGEFVINKKAASRIGASKLGQLNRADRIQGFNKGGAVGSVQNFATGGSVDAALASMSPRDSAKLKAAIQKNVATFARLDKLIDGWPVKDASDAIKNLARSLNQGSSDVDVALNKAVTASKGIPSARQQKKGILQQTTGASESRGAGTVGFARFAASGDAVVRAQKGLSDAGFAPESQATKKALLTFNTTLRQTGDEQKALIAAVNSATRLREQEHAAIKQGIQAQQRATQSLTVSQKVSGAFSGAGNRLSSMANAIVPGRAGRAISAVGGGAINLARNSLGVNGAQSFLPAFMQRGGTAGATSRAATRGGGMGGMGGLVATMAGGVVVDTLSKNLGGESTAAGRRTSSMGSQALNYGAMGAMIGSVIPGLGTAFGALTGAAIGATMGFFEAEKAGKEYAQSQRQAASEVAAEKSGTAISKFMESGKASDRSAAISAFREFSTKEAALGSGIERQRSSSFGKMLGYRDESLGDYSQRVASSQKAGADQAQQFLVAEMNRTGKTFAEISSTMNPADFQNLANNIAEADNTYQHAVKSGALTAAEQEALAKRIAARKMAEQDAAIQAKKAAEASAALAKSTIVAVMSLERTFDVMGQALNRASFSIEESASKIDSIISGQASLTSNVFKRDANVLGNLDAYGAPERKAAIDRSAGMLGATGSATARIATFAPQARDTALRIANQQRASLRPGPEANKEIADTMKDTLRREIEASFGAGTSIAETAIRSMETKINAALDSVDPTAELDVQSILDDAVGPLIQASEQAAKRLQQANELMSNSLESLARVSSEVANIQQRQIDRTNSLMEMQSSSSMALNESLGIKQTSQDKILSRMTLMAQRTGVGDPSKVTGSELAKRRTQAVAEQRLLSQKIETQTPEAVKSEKAAKELANLQIKLQTVNNTISSLDKELDNLPQVLESNLSDLFTDIQDRVSQLEVRKEAGANFAEKLVGSTPQELLELNQTYALLNNTLRGNVTTINQSQQAQQAYFLALQNGKTQQEAMAEAQGAFANENKKALSLFTELSQVAGIQGPQFDKMRADLLENFARAQGAGLQNNPMFQKIIQELRRDPAERANDPVLQALVTQADAIKKAQVDAVTEQNKIDRDAQAQLLNNVGQKIIQDLNQARVQIDVAVQGAAANVGAAVVRRSMGGIIYASQGQLVNFEPRGTDTVPAMLTPGEFVVNAKQTKKNLPLLQKINSGYYASGGRVLQGVSLPEPPDPLLSNIFNNTKSTNNSLNKQQSKLSTIDKNTTYASQTLEKIERSSGFSSGGIVYAANGGKIGKGSDTVPAMLSPGEFVVNSQSTKDNLGLLQSINSGYYARGGLIPPDLRKTVNPLIQAVRFNQLQRFANSGLGGLPDDKKFRWSSFLRDFVSYNPMFGLLPTFGDPEPAMIDQSETGIDRSQLQTMKPNGYKSVRYLDKERVVKQLAKNIQNTDPLTVLLNEIDYQKNIPGISDFNDNALPRARNGLVIFNEYKDKILADPNQAQILYDRNTFRQNYLDNILSNIRPALDLLNSQALDRRGQAAKQWLEQQQSGAEKETKLIDKIWTSLKQPNLNLPLGFLVKNQTKNFSPESFPTASYLNKGGQVEDPAQKIISQAKAAENYKQSRASKALQNELNRISKSSFGKQYNVDSTVDSVVSALSRYNPQKLDTLSQAYPEIKQKQQQLLKERELMLSMPDPFNKGGVVYASKGTLVPYQPKGTDTVPAMLTPGEFVVNRQAAQRNLPLLQSINSGYYSQGGKVAYLAEGTPGSSELMNNLLYLSEIIKFGADTINKSFQKAIDQLNNITDRTSINNISQGGVSNNGSNPIAAIDVLGSRLDRFIEQLQASIPSVIKVEGQHQVNVVVNGASILQNVLGGPIGDIVQKAIQSAFEAKSRANEGN
jgi:hypothetical protein